MKVDQFDYHLPQDRIAQHPLSKRDESRLLVLRRREGKIEEKLFRDIWQLLDPGDLLVVNDTRVRPARVRGRKTTGANMEITLIKRLEEPEVWECLIRGKKPGPGTKISVPDGIEARVLERAGSEVRVDAQRGAPLWKVRFSGGGLEAALEEQGLMPLPPYIRREPGDDPGEDRERYQTVYSKEGEAVAAPTAGLHFSHRLLARLDERGVERASIRLDVSYGTFAPVRSPEVEDHVMHPERYQVPEETAEAVARARGRGSRVVAVGTTVVRTLEHCGDGRGGVLAGAGETALFIYPGFEFKVTDAMITNFHMPRSTLIMLAAAFAGRELLLSAYDRALEGGFRFLSYGDAMLIL